MMQGKKNPALKKQIKQNLWKLMTHKYPYTMTLKKHSDDVEDEVKDSW